MREVMKKVHQNRALPCPHGARVARRRHVRLRAHRRPRAPRAQTHVITHLHMARRGSPALRPQILHCIYTNAHSPCQHINTLHSLACKLQAHKHRPDLRSTSSPCCATPLPPPSPLMHHATPTIHTTTNMASQHPTSHHKGCCTLNLHPCTSTCATSTLRPTHHMLRRCPAPDATLHGVAP